MNEHNLMHYMWVELPKKTWMRDGYIFPDTAVLYCIEGRATGHGRLRYGEPIYHDQRPEGHRVGGLRVLIPTQWSRWRVDGGVDLDGHKIVYPGIAGGDAWVMVLVPDPQAEKGLSYTETLRILREAGATFGPTDQPGNGLRATLGCAAIDLHGRDGLVLATHIRVAPSAGERMVPYPYLGPLTVAETIQQFLTIASGDHVYRPIEGA